MKVALRNLTLQLVYFYLAFLRILLDFQFEVVPATPLVTSKIIFFVRVFEFPIVDLDSSRLRRQLHHIRPVNS